MDDRTLLELAAKAAGMNVVDTASPGLRISSDGCCAGYYWNPLTDDGDALRLAVKMRITPDFNPNASYGVFTGYETVNSGKRGYHSPITEKFGDDDFAATRRAIVRRAAEIGKAMP